MMEYGVRQAGRRNKVTARFPDLADLAREAAYIARQEGAALVSDPHVRRAREARIERHNLTETKIREMIEEGTLMIDTDGARVGQVNGLSVLELGGYAFGKPVRITASEALGKTGVINAERESNVDCPFHVKGLQLIALDLQPKFA